MSTTTKVHLERKIGSPSFWWYHAKLYQRQDFKMCDNFVSFGQRSAFQTEGTAYAKPLDQWFLNSSVHKPYLLFANADFQVSRDEVCSRAQKSEFLTSLPDASDSDAVVICYTLNNTDLGFGKPLLKGNTLFIFYIFLFWAHP